MRGDVNAAMEEKYERFSKATLRCMCVYGVLFVVSFI